MVPTPVWFAVERDAVYVITDARSGKIKRIRNDPRIGIAPCTMRGKRLGGTVDAAASILAEIDREGPVQLLNRKYGKQFRLFTLLHGERLAHSVIVQIRPPSAT